MYFSRAKALWVALVCLAALYFSLPNLLPTQLLPRVAPYLLSSPLPLGLDLQGGVSLLLEVDTTSNQQNHYASLSEDLRTALRKQKIGYSLLRAENFGISIALRDPAQADLLLSTIRKLQPHLEIRTESPARYLVVYDAAYQQELANNVMEQSIEVVRRRVDETGTTEPSIQRQGENRILLQVPGLHHPDALKSILGKTAQLTFHLLKGQPTLQRPLVMRSAQSLYLPELDETGVPSVYYPLDPAILLSGDMLIQAKAAFHEGRPVVSFSFNTDGSKRFATVTKQHVGERFAIVLDDQVVSAPVINEPILGGSGIIMGQFTVAQANELAMLLRAGALPAPLHIIEERVVGPSLGSDSIAAGKHAALVGTVLVIFFMLFTYRMFGMIATVALAINMLLLIAILSLLQATLTMPGIAGMVLTMGMAVDANVLIFERIREEARQGTTPSFACERGFQHAYRAILDSNITTLIVAFLLYVLGNGPVKGFAVTLSVGLITSMFTAITLTKCLIATWLHRNPKPKLIL